MKQIITIALFAFVTVSVHAQTILFNGTPVTGDTVYMQKGTSNTLMWDFVKPTNGIIQFQALMNAQPIACGSQWGPLGVNEKGRYKMRVIWYHDGTAEILYKRLVYVKYGK